MKVEELINYLHEIAPNNYQEDYDNSGHLVGNDQDEITSVLVSLDVTEKVLDEAIDLGANLIVSHHPIIFGGLKRLTGQNYVQRIVQKAIKHDLNLFSIHTNLDNVLHNGVNGYIAKILNLKNVNILRPKVEFHSDSVPIGSGIIGQLDNPVTEMEFLSHLKSKMQTKCIKYTQLLNKNIQKVAICGGSGRFLLNDAIYQDADIFISSDFKYHEFFDADNQIVIADIGHFESEQFTIKMLHEILTNKFNNFATRYTKVNTNPVNYL
jgi:dinuclear metal center YbgI/SA1388 family protein